MGLTNCKEVLSGKAAGRRRAAQSRRRAGGSLTPPSTRFGQSPLSPGPTVVPGESPAIAVPTEAASRSLPPTPSKKHNGRADVTRASFGRSCLWASFPGSRRIFSLEKQGSCALHSCGGDQWGNSETNQHSPLCSSPISALLARSGPDTLPSDRFAPCPLPLHFSFLSTGNSHGLLCHFLLGSCGWKISV